MQIDGDEILRTYYQRCTRPEEADSSADPVGDTQSTLGKRRAAITHFYRWAVSTGRLDTFPFATVVVQTRRGPQDVVAGLRGGRRSVSECEALPSQQIERFHRVGLLGELADDGGPDPSFLGYATGRRNAAGFALYVGAGLRHSEVLAFTTFELPPPHPDGLTAVAVGDQTAKGDVGRKVVAFSRWLQAVQDNVDTDRRAIARGATWRPEEPLVIIRDTTGRRFVTYEKAGRRFNLDPPPNLCDSGRA